MKKIFLFAYTMTNLGDDIFLKMLVSKYSDCEFYINIPEIEHRSAFIRSHNVRFVENETDNRNLDNIDISLYDAFIYIGGSIFQENPCSIVSKRKFDAFIKKCKVENKPFFYVSSNFGPYKTEEYFEVVKSIMENCTDICFRDKYSFDLFSSISGVRYAPDLIFSYDVGEVVVERDTVGISVIDFEIRDKLKEFSNKYFELLTKSIELYISMGKRVVLFSFCKYEGDESGINKLLACCSDKIRDKISVVFYDGDIDKFLESYKSVEYMICTRFHSMILSLICKQKLYCLSYSEKMNNVIDDLELGVEVMDIKDIEYSFIDISKFRDVDANKINECRVRASGQFKAVDGFIY